MIPLQIPLLNLPLRDGYGCVVISDYRFACEPGHYTTSRRKVVRVKHNWGRVQRDVRSIHVASFKERVSFVTKQHGIRLHTGVFVHGETIA